MLRLRSIRKMTCLRLTRNRTTLTVIDSRTYGQSISLTQLLGVVRLVGKVRWATVHPVTFQYFRKRFRFDAVKSSGMRHAFYFFRGIVEVVAYLVASPQASQCLILFRLEHPLVIVLCDVIGYRWNPKPKSIYGAHNRAASYLLLHRC